jgi:hypothetical protein
MVLPGAHDSLNPVLRIASNSRDIEIHGVRQGTRAERALELLGGGFDDPEKRYIQ